MRLDQEGPLEKEMATHSSILAWDNPMDSRACWAIVHGIKEESDTTWWLNNKWFLTVEDLLKREKKQLLLECF